MVLGTGLALVASWSLAEPRRPPSAPPPPPTEYAPPPPVSPAPAETCAATLIVRQTRAAAGCAIDERVTRAPGVLQFPCAGGAAAVTFGDSQFTGTVQGGMVDLSLRTRFHFSDGCDWESAQRIAGELASGQLTFTYIEAPLPGQSRCANACQAYGAVQVQR